LKIFPVCVIVTGHSVGLFSERAAGDEGESSMATASLKDGSDHGHGLKNVKRSVNKYGGNMKIAHEGGVFTVSILLYGDDG